MLVAYSGLFTWKYSTEVSFNQNQMRNHLLKLFELDQISGFPTSSSEKVNCLNLSCFCESEG